MSINFCGISESTAIANYNRALSRVENSPPGQKASAKAELANAASQLSFARSQVNLTQSTLKQGQGQRLDFKA